MGEFRRIASLISQGGFYGYFLSFLLAIFKGIRFSVGLEGDCRPGEGDVIFSHESKQATFLFPPTPMIWLQGKVWNLTMGCIYATVYEL